MNPVRQTILFQGDSITDGNRSRNEDPYHILGNGYAFIIAGKLGFELAGNRPHFINRGVGGNRAVRAVYIESLGDRGKMGGVARTDR